MYIIYELISRVKVYGAFVTILAVLIMSLGRILTSLNLTWATNDAYYAQPLLVFHIIVLLIAFAALIIGGISAGLIMYQNALLKKRKETALGRRIPSLPALKQFSRISILVGFPFLTVGQFIGIIMMLGQSYTPWYVAPRIVLVVIVWLMCIVYLFQMSWNSGTSRTSSLIAVTIGVLTVLLLIIMGVVPMFMSEV